MRIDNAQKIITTYGTNKAGIVIGVIKCSEPIEALKNIQSILLVKSRPIVKKKSVVHKPELKENENPNLRRFASG